MNGHLRTIRQALIALAVVFALALVVRAYAPAQAGPFLWDDHVLAREDAPFREAPLPSLLTHPFWPESGTSDARAPYYRPLVLLSLRFDAALGGTPVEYHFTNLFVHLVALCLLVLTARRLGAQSEAALLAALAWALAPRLTESVAWISGRTDVLAGAFGLAALVLSPDVPDVVGASAAAERTDEHAPVGASRATGREQRLFGAVRASGAAVCLFAALLAKEVAIAFAIALGVEAIIALRRTPERARGARMAATVLIPVGVWLALRSIALTSVKRPEHALGVLGRAGTVLETTARYAEMIVDFARPRTSIGLVGELDTARLFAGGVVLVALVVLVLRHGRRLSAGARIGLVLAASALAPVLHVVPLALSGSVAADRLLYVPLMGIVLAAAVITTRIGPRARALTSVAALPLVAVSFAVTRTRAADYADEARFWVVAAEHAHSRNVAPRNALAHVAMRADAFDLACPLYERSGAALADTPLAWSPTHKRTLESLANCWARIGRYDDAVRLLDDLARRYPDSGRVQMELGFARLHVRDFDGSAAAFTRAAALDPALERITGPVLADLPRTRRDDLAPDRSDPHGPRFVDARHLADLGRLPEAEAAYLAIVGDPSSPEVSRQVAIDYLVSDGPLETAENVIGRTNDDFRRGFLDNVLRGRRARRGRIEALRQRIDALTR